MTKRKLEAYNQLAKALDAFIKAHGGTISNFSIGFIQEFPEIDNCYQIVISCYGKLPRIMREKK